MLCVRGVSDIVGFKRSEGWTEFACRSAASFVHAVVTRLPLEVFRDQTISHSLREAYSDFPFRIRRAFNVARDMLQNIADLSTQRQYRTPTLEQIAVAFAKSSKSLVSRVVEPSERISRDELKKLESFPSSVEANVLCVLGSPGSGKTALLALFAKNALDAGACTFGVKADLLPVEMAFESWGRWSSPNLCTSMNERILG